MDGVAAMERSRIEPGAPGEGRSGTPARAVYAEVMAVGETGDPVSARCRKVLDAIDALNAQDPTRIEHGGELVAKEPLHAALMTRWLERLEPEPDEVQRIAARGHHVQRWRRPRADYPVGRRGYLRWRSDAKRFHADVVAALMEDVGYDESATQRTSSIIRKEGLGRDPWVQVHEDALCLVFLDTQLEPTATRLGDDEMIRVLERTIPKMSPAGLAAAAELDLGPKGRVLLERALAGAASPGSANTLVDPPPSTREEGHSDGAR